MKLHISAAAAVCAFSAGAYAQFLPSPQGDAFYLQAPVSQVGTAVNFTNLTLINLPNLTSSTGVSGFILYGWVDITVPAGPISGTLVEWSIARLIDPAWAGNVHAYTSVVGFSAPPPGGVYGNSVGFASTLITSNAASAADVPLSVTGGLASWNLSVNGINAPYTPGVHYLVQRFSIDAAQVLGPGGIWTIDMPLDSFISFSPVPSPASAALWMIGLSVVAARRVRASASG